MGSPQGSSSVCPAKYTRMGVYNLWNELAAYDNVVLSLLGGGGGADDRNADIVAEVHGKTLAIDTSVWILQASQQADAAAAIEDEVARILYVVIFRASAIVGDRGWAGGGGAKPGERRGGGRRW